MFTAFSVLHAASILGWRRSLAFLLVCAVVSWCFEEVGVSTGLVYGAYHYSSRLGAKLGEVPLIIPLAWFMMVYASWTVARLLLDGAGSSTSGGGTAARIVTAAMVMTAWDTVMDPGMARSGAWTWEPGGAYFGVPLHNFAGWLATTITVYTVAELLFRRMEGDAPAVVAASIPVCPRSFMRSLPYIDCCYRTRPSCVSSPRSASASSRCWRSSASRSVHQRPFRRAISPSSSSLAWVPRYSGVNVSSVSARG